MNVAKRTIYVLYAFPLSILLIWLTLVPTWRKLGFNPRDYLFVNCILLLLLLLWIIFIPFLNKAVMLGIIYRMLLHASFTILFLTFFMIGVYETSLFNKVTLGGAGVIGGISVIVSQVISYFVLHYKIKNLEKK